MKLIHITDIHLTSENKKIIGLDPNDNFKKCINHINNQHPDADRIVITGDLAHKGHIEAYQNLSTYLKSISIPVDLVIGNHDHRGNFFSIFPHTYKDEEGFAQGYTDTTIGRFIYLDTVGGTLSTPQISHAGYYDKVRMEWLEKQLLSSKEQNIPAYLFMHHHPRNILIKPCDILGLQEKDEIQALFKKYNDTIHYIFFGHCHLILSGVMAGIPFSSLRGTNHQVLADFSNSRKFKVAPLSPVYNVVLFEKDDVIIHTIDFLHGEKYKEVGTSWEEWDKYGEGPN
jgi:3',5'-cyclic AMP phosphodiesterase CpdA